MGKPILTVVGHCAQERALTIDFWYYLHLPLRILVLLSLAIFKIKNRIRGNTPQMAFRRQPYLNLVHGDLETIRPLPSNFRELEDVSQKFLRSLSEDVFGLTLRVPIEYASINNATRMVTDPYIYLTDEDSYQAVIMGMQTLRVEILTGASSPHHESPPPPSPTGLGPFEDLGNMQGSRIPSWDIWLPNRDITAQEENTVTTESPSIVCDAPALQDEPFDKYLYSEDRGTQRNSPEPNPGQNGEFETVFDAMASKYLLKVDENDNQAQTPIATLEVGSPAVDGVPFVSQHPKPDDLTGLIFREDHVAKGGGGFADVYKGVLTDRKQVKTHVAIKVIRSHIYTEHSRNKILKRLRREIFVWIGLQRQHPNVLPLLGISMDFGPYEAMVCPWMQDGDLNHFLDQSRKTLTLSQRFDILNDVSAGLAYLHSKAIIHGDLTSANVLMENGKAYLCDFGLSNVMVEFQVTSLITSNVAGSCRWTAPELFPVGAAIETKPVITKACDIYSFGCITLHVISGHRPYENIQRNEQVLLEMFLGRLPSRPTEPLLNDDCWEFINNCWSRNASERLDIVAVEQQLSKSKSSYQPQFLSYLLQGAEIDND